MAYDVQKTDEQWREELSPEEYAVLRQAGTEPPFTGQYTSTTTNGVYSCGACGAELFRSEAKFDSHCGWPSFFTPLAGDAVVEIEDRSLGMLRVEVRCATCRGLLNMAPCVSCTLAGRKPVYEFKRFVNRADKTTQPSMEEPNGESETGQRVWPSREGCKAC